MTRAIVIGGGVAGLATSAVLARGGHEVTLLERHGTLGGRAARFHAKGFSLDLGPSWFTSAEAFERFFALLGRDVHDHMEFLPVAPRFRCFFEGQGDAPADVWDAAPDLESVLDSLDRFSRGDGEGARAYLAKAADDYHRVLETFMSSSFDGLRSAFNPAILKEVPGLLAGLSRPLDRRIAKAVHHPRARQILGFPAVALAGSPARLPSAYAFLSHLLLGQDAVHPRGGYATVVDAVASLAREEGVDLRTESDVARILVDPHTRLATGVVLHGGALLPADVVVSCVDLHFTETALLTGEFQSRPEHAWRHLRPAPSALVAAFSTKHPINALAHHNLLFPLDWESSVAGLASDHAGKLPSPAFLYVSRPSATDRGTVPKGRDALVITAPLPADPLLGSTDSSRGGMEDLAREYLAQVAAWAGSPEIAERAELLEMVTPSILETRYGSWHGSAMGLDHTRAQTAMFRPKNASSRVHNLLYAGSSTLPGVGVASALVSAELVAKRLLADRGSKPLAVPAAPGFLSPAQLTTAESSDAVEAEV